MKIFQMLAAFQGAFNEVFSDSSLQKLAAALSAPSAADDLSLLISSQPNLFNSTVEGCVMEINSTECSLKKKASALSILSNMAKTVPAREPIMRQLQRINTKFEALLDEKERAHETLGTSLGPLHVTTLVTLMRCTNYRMGAGDLLEFTNQNMVFALELLSSILKVVSYEAGIVTNCMTCLAGLTSPTAYIAGRDLSDIAATSFVTEVIEPLLSKVMSTNVIGIVTEAMARVAITCSPTTLIALQRFLSNLVRFSTEGGTAFRQHVTVISSLPTKVLLPYLAKAAGTFSSCTTIRDGAKADPGTVQGARAALQTLTLVVFQMGISTQTVVRMGNTASAALLECSPLLPLRLLADVILFNVNLGTFEGEYDLPEGTKLPEECLGRSMMTNLSIVLQQLSHEQLSELHDVVVGLTGVAEPVDRTSTSHSLVVNLLESFLEASSTPPQPMPTTAPVATTHLQDLPCLRSQVEAPPGPRRDVVPARTTPQPPTPGAPKEFCCMINGHVMKHPVRTPDGHVYEKDTLDVFISRAGWMDPLSGKPLRKEDCVPDKALERRIIEYHVQQTVKASLAAGTVQSGDDDLYDF